MKDVIVQKQLEMEQISKTLASAKSFVIFNYAGMTAIQAQNLRRAALKENARVVVAKNTLIERAMQKNQLKGYEPMLSGQIAMIFGTSNEMAPFKLAADFIKIKKTNQIKGGMLEGKPVDEKSCLQLSTIPSKNDLYSMLASVLQAPMRNLAYSLKLVTELQPTT